MIELKEMVCVSVRSEEIVYSGTSGTHSVTKLTASSAIENSMSVFEFGESTHQGDGMRKNVPKSYPIVLIVPPEA